MSDPAELMQPEFSFRLLSLFRAIDTLLADHHTLRAALKPGHPPFGAFENGIWRPISLEAGIKRYGAGPIFGLWTECRDVEALRVVWTGKPSPVVEPEPEQEPETAQPESTQESTPTEAAP
jgi:hypothetical protein